MEHGRCLLFLIGSVLQSAVYIGLILCFLLVCLPFIVRKPHCSHIYVTQRIRMFGLLFFIYVAIGLAIVLPFIFTNLTLLWISLGIAPFFMLNLLFARLKKERWFINDLIAITALSALLLFAYGLTEPAIQSEAYIYTLINILFFTGSVFHVKSLIREKHNKTFHKASLMYHVAVVILTFALQWYGAALGLLVSLVKTLFVPKKYLMRPMQIGVVEIINSSLFFLFIVLFY